jgi:DNA primase
MEDRVDLKEVIEKFDLENFLDDNNIDYKITFGSSGEQINLKECPRCNGNDWKVYLSRDLGIGNCFHGSCVGEWGFNKYTFVKHFTRENDRGVINLLVEDVKKQGWRPPVQHKVFKFETRDFELPTNIKLNKTNNHKYLEDRGFDGEIVEYFDLRYSNYGEFAYTDFENESQVQKYFKRIIIPIYDITGKLVTFQGRAIQSDANRKYLFPPMLPGSGKYLFNIENALNASHLVIGEGVFDVMAIYKAFKNNAVMQGYEAIGSFGITFSMVEEGQLGQLKKLLKKSNIKSITFMWDGSKMAIKQAYKCAIEVASHIDCEVRVATLSANKDPNEVEESEIFKALEHSKLATKINYMKVMGKLK